MSKSFVKTIAASILLAAMGFSIQTSAQGALGKYAYIAFRTAKGMNVVSQKIKTPSTQSFSSLTKQTSRLIVSGPSISTINRDVPKLQKPCLDRYEETKIIAPSLDTNALNYSKPVVKSVPNNTASIRKP